MYYIESPCAYTQGLIPATPGHTVLGQLSAKPHLASHVAHTIPCGHRVHLRVNTRVLFRDKILKYQA